tara:strand:- start:6 stop:722 length:717 start_codon:yes stop_codon:yes gene_type:complete
MIIEKRQLREIICRVLTEDTRDRELDMISFVRTHKKDLVKLLGVSYQEIKMLSIAAMCVAGRESSYGEWWQYKLTNPIETLLSYTGIKDTSIGATQTKYSTATADEEYAEKIGVTSEWDTTDELKSMLLALGILSRNYKKALGLGYSKKSSGHISGSIADKKANQKFKSTGSAALDLAITAFNGDPDKVLIKRSQGRNYIPCYGDGCVNDAQGGLTSYHYVKSVGVCMRKKSSYYTKF